MSIEAEDADGAADQRDSNELIIKLLRTQILLLEIIANAEAGVTEELLE